MKSEVERELAKTRANLAEVIKAKEGLQQELSRDKSLMYESANKLRDREDTRQNTLRENCVQRERKQFTVPEILERSERLKRKKDSEVNSFIITFKVLHGMAPDYLRHLISVLPPSRYNLRRNDDYACPMFKRLEHRT